MWINVVPSCHVSLGSESATGSSCGMHNKWTTNHGENIVTAESVDEFQPQCHNAMDSFSVLHSTVKKPFIAFASQFSACRPEAFWSDFLFRNSALCGNDSALQCHYLLTSQHCGKSTSCLIFVHPEKNGSFTLIISYLHLSTVQSAIIHDHPCTMCLNWRVARNLPLAAGVQSVAAPVIYHHVSDGFSSSDDSSKGNKSIKLHSKGALEHTAEPNYVRIYSLGILGAVPHNRLSQFRIA